MTQPQKDDVIEAVFSMIPLLVLLGTLFFFGMRS